MSTPGRSVSMLSALLATALIVHGASLSGAVKYTLTTSVVPTGGGTITPEGGTYSRNNYITVTAIPVEGCEFDHWGGQLSGSQNPTNYRFDTGQYNVTFIAYFVSDSVGGGECEPPPPPDPPDPLDAQVIGYFPEWGVYHRQPYYVKNIDTSGAAEGLTILNYAFVVPAPNANGDVVCQLDDPVAAYQQMYTSDMSVDAVPDMSGSALRGHFNQLQKLKWKHTELKLVASIGGWLGSTWFSDAAASPAARRVFVSSCLDLLVDGNLPVANGAGGPGAAAGLFDGFDLDWEYPVAGGAQGTHHRSTDGANYSLLLQEFRDQFDQRGRDDNEVDDLLLTMAGPGGHYRAQNFRMSADHPNLDYVLIMTYDYHGSWERTTGHHTNLCTSPDDPASETWRSSIDKSVKLYRDQYGVPAAKLIPGMAFYARGWKGVRITNNGLHQRGSGAAPGVYEAGANYYRDLPLDAQGVPINGSGFTRHWDAKAKAPWLFNPTTGIFWSYDDRESVGLKGEYIRFWRLGGGMTWELTGDTDASDLFSRMLGSLTADPPQANPCSN